MAHLLLAFTLRDAGDEAASGAAQSRPAGGRFWRALFARPGFWILLALNVLVGVTNWLVYGWLPTYLKDHFGLGLGAAGMSATGYIQVASFAGALTGGAWADRRSRQGRGRALVPAIGYLVAGPCLFLAASTDTLPVAVAGLLMFGLGRGFFDANLMPILRELVDERYSATGYGFLNFIGSAAGGVMVYASGALKDQEVDLGYVFQSAAVTLAIVGLMLLLLTAVHSARRPESGEDLAAVTAIPGSTRP